MNRYLEKIADNLNTYNLDSNKPIKGMVVGTLLAPGVGTIAGYVWGKGKENKNMEAARQYLKNTHGIDASGLSREGLLRKVYAMQEKQAGLLDLARKLSSGVMDFAKSEGFKQKVGKGLEGLDSAGRQMKSIGDNALGKDSPLPGSVKALRSRDRMALGTGAALGAGAGALAFGGNKKSDN